jgi:hypothetical protein
VIVFRGDEDVSVEAGDLFFPAQCRLVLRRRIGQRHLFLEERHGIVAQIDNLEIGVIALFGDIEQPVGRDIREPPRTGRADDDSDFGSLLHCRFPILRLVSNDMAVTETGARRHFFRRDLLASK